MPPTQRVYGLGDPVLDIVSRVDDAVLQQLGAEPGGCVVVTAHEMAALLALPKVQADMHRVPGGSAANVMKGLASLAGSSSSSSSSSSSIGGNSNHGSSSHGDITGSKNRSISNSSNSSNTAGASLSVLFVGMVGRDVIAEEYRASIAAHGVLPVLLQSPLATADTDACAKGPADAAAAAAASATATCLCLVTPDGQRTMRTALGAAVELRDASQLPAPLGGAGGSSSGGSIGGCSIGVGSGDWGLLHCEGYCLYRATVAAAAMRAAHAAGARVSLDLASFEVIKNCWGRLDELLQERLVDVVFCNEQEAAALCQAASLPLPEGDVAELAVAAVQRYLLSRGATTVVVSRGSKGCSAKSADGSKAQASARSVQLVDTIGAGDFFTAGFLFALLSGASLQACARCGCASGTAAVQVAGAELGPAVVQRLQSDIAGILAADSNQAAAAGVAAAEAVAVH